MEFSDSLARSIIEKVGEQKEAWLVFDMDGTLAQWKKRKTEDVFSLRPTVVPFLQTIINANIKINFAIYSNNTTKSKVETIASTIESGLDKKSLFDVCFLFYNHFKKNAGESSLRRLNINTNVRSLNEKRQVYDMNKTLESIEHGFRESGAALPESMKKTHLFFFDDVDYPLLRAAIGANYIHMKEYKEEIAEQSSQPSRGTKRNASGNPKARRFSNKRRRTRRN